MRMIKKIKENLILLVLFLLSTIFFLYQHNAVLAWDFSAYILNAKYLFYEGTYFEVYRAPMTSILLGFFLIFDSLAEYLFIILVATLFLWGNIKLGDAIHEKFSESYNIKKEIFLLVFYIFSLSPFVLKYATSVGTELLGLAFFELFLASFIKNKTSGHFLALAFLTRYNFLLFAPLLLINKNYKQIIKNLIAFVILICPWLFFNFIKYGNWFTSIIDSYALNVANRTYTIQPFEINSIFIVAGILIPFLIIGTFSEVQRMLMKKNKSLNRYSLLFLIIFLLIIYDFYNTPFKITRYLFNLSLPIAFISAIGFSKIYVQSEKIKKPLLLIVILIFSLSLLTLSVTTNQIKIHDDKFYDAAQDIAKLKINNCEILSPHWVPVTYYTENVYPLGETMVDGSINQDKIILLFKNEESVDFQKEYTNFEGYYHFYETEEYLFLSKENVTRENCSKKYVYDKPYTTNHCLILSDTSTTLKSFILKICTLINKK